VVGLPAFPNLKDNTMKSETPKLLIRLGGCFELSDSKLIASTPLGVLTVKPYPPKAKP
jgi:hypothetical protein